MACIYIKEGEYQNKRVAYILFERAAQNNNMVGIMYLTGEGVNLQSDAMALEYFKRAQALGFNQATIEIEKIEARAEAAKERARSSRIDLNFEGRYLNLQSAPSVTVDQIAAAQKMAQEFKDKKQLFLRRALDDTP